MKRVKELYDRLVEAGNNKDYKNFIYILDLLGDEINCQHRLFLEAEKKKEQSAP